MNKVTPAAKRCIGNRYGKLQVKSVSWEKGKGSNLGNYVNCVCDCGNHKIIRADSLERGDSTSCGCSYGTPVGVKFYSRKTSDHPMYRIFNSMQKRCKNVNNKDYEHYGGRGIEVCPEWDTKSNPDAFPTFVKDMESTYEKGLEIERLDVNGNYCPENCTWVCRRSQVNNLRRNRIMSGYGLSLSLAEWGEFLDFDPKMLGDRINKLGWEGDLPEILSICFKDKQYSLEYKGSICSAREIFKAEGLSDGRRNAMISKYGDSLSALREVGIDFKILKHRDKDHLTFEEGLERLRTKVRNPFEEHLLKKVEKQIGETYE